MFPAINYHRASPTNTSSRSLQLTFLHKTHNERQSGPTRPFSARERGRAGSRTPGRPQGCRDPPPSPAETPRLPPQRPRDSKARPSPNGSVPPRVRRAPTAAYPTPPAALSRPGPAQLGRFRPDSARSCARASPGPAPALTHLPSPPPRPQRGARARNGCLRGSGCGGGPARRRTRVRAASGGGGSLRTPFSAFSPVRARWAAPRGQARLRRDPGRGGLGGGRGAPRTHARLAAVTPGPEARRAVSLSVVRGGPGRSRRGGEARRGGRPRVVPCGCWRSSCPASGGTVPPGTRARPLPRP